MPIFFFNLKTRDGAIPDQDGTELLDEQTAWEHARLVARELMRHREPRTRAWRLDVCDSEGRHCFNLLFAIVDDSICHLTPELRSSVEDLCAKSGSLFETIHETRLMLLELKGTIARSEGAPYLAAVNGVGVR